MDGDDDVGVLEEGRAAGIAEADAATAAAGIGGGLQVDTTRQRALQIYERRDSLVSLNNGDRKRPHALGAIPDVREEHVVKSSLGGQVIQIALGRHLRR